MSWRLMRPAMEQILERGTELAKNAACPAASAGRTDGRPPCGGILDQSASPLRRWNSVW